MKISLRKTALSTIAAGLLLCASGANAENSKVVLATYSADTGLTVKVQVAVFGGVTRFTVAGYRPNEESSCNSFIGYVGNKDPKIKDKLQVLLAEAQERALKYVKNPTSCKTGNTAKNGDFFDAEINGNFNHVK